MQQIVVHKTPNGEIFSEIRFGNSFYWLGTFDTEDEAIKAWEEAEKHLDTDFLEWYKEYTIKKGGFLTEYEKKVYKMYSSGMCKADIAKKLELYHSNVARAIHKAEKKMKGELLTSRKVRIDYDKYKTADLSCLTNRERQVIEMRIQGYYLKEIAEKFGVLVGTIGIQSNVAVKKLDGTYSIEEVRKKNREAKRREHARKLEKIKERNRSYQKSKKEKN